MPTNRPMAEGHPGSRRWVLASRVLLLLCLLMQVPLVAAEIPVFSSASFLNDRPFQSVSGPEDGEATGTLLELLSGVTATGKGVIVGIIDTGIDWRHPDFRDPADSLRSRILGIWDMNAELGHPPAGFDYGREWTRDEIEAALRGEGPDPPRDTFHGTFVAGLAAGNGNADPRYRGMAPEAEIVVVIPGVKSITENLSFGGLNVPDAVRYISAAAESKGWPAVVNYSGGIPFGYREEDLESLLRQKPGRALVAAAGNVGQQQHVRFDLEETASYTIYRTLEEVPLFWTREEVPGRRYRWLVAYHQGPGEAWIGTGRSGQEMVWRSLNELADLGGEPDGHPLFVVDPEYVMDSLVTAAGDTVGRIAWSGHFVGDDIWLQIMVEDWMPEPVDWRVAARGSGVLHAWILSYEPQDVPEPGPTEDPRFQPLDNRFTLSYPSTSAEVISVGAFANQVPENFEGLQAGDLMPYSSRGPSLEGFLKPDLVAPCCLTAPGDGPTKYQPTGGTSASAAVVSGAVALYFERFPQATNREVWGALTESATSDEFTGDTPNLDWGYGKLDVAAFLQEPPTVVAAEAGGAIPSGFSLQQNYPNPFNGRTAISYRLPGSGHVELILYDLLGRRVRRLVSEFQEAGSHQVAWDGADDRGRVTASGVYLYRLKAVDQQLSRRLLLVR